jgi:multiple sugar transport system permease protein
LNAATGVATRGPISRMLEREGALAFWLLVPTLVLLTLFIAYPFVRGVWLSLTSSVVGVPGDFVGLKNFAKIWNDSIFRTAALNTFVYTGVTTVFKLALGLWLALLLNRHFRGKAWVRAFILLPFWKLSIINARINWLGDPELAMASIMAVNVWRGVPFFAISLLAGLQTINQDLHEAAAIDGANRFQRFWYVTWPLLLPVTMVVVLFSVIQTFADFQLVYVLTGGGPANATHLFATYDYQIGIGTGLLSEGAAISLAMFPALLLVVVFQLWYIRRVENR